MRRIATPALGILRSVKILLTKRAGLAGALTFFALLAVAGWSEVKAVLAPESKVATLDTSHMCSETSQDEVLFIGCGGFF